jgi:hypothetical protein
MTEKYVFYAIMLFGNIGISFSVHADQYIRPLKSGTNQVDYKRNSYLVEGEYIRPLKPGANQVDYKQTSYRVEGDFTRPLKPGTNEIDYRKPSMHK